MISTFYFVQAHRITFRDCSAEGDTVIFGLEY